jgi:hypothetical protein
VRFRTPTILPKGMGMGTFAPDPDGDAGPVRPFDQINLEALLAAAAKEAQGVPPLLADTGLAPGPGAPEIDGVDPVPGRSVPGLADEPAVPGTTGLSRYAVVGDLDERVTEAGERSVGSDLHGAAAAPDELAETVLPQPVRRASPLPLTAAELDALTAAAPPPPASPRRAAPPLRPDPFAAAAAPPAPPLRPDPFAAAPPVSEAPGSQRFPLPPPLPQETVDEQMPGSALGAPDAALVDDEVGAGPSRSVPDVAALLGTLREHVSEPEVADVDETPAEGAPAPGEDRLVLPAVDPWKPSDDDIFPGRSPNHRRKRPALRLRRGVS